MKKEIISQLSIHFDNVLSPYISGFRKRHSCETVLIRMIESIRKSLDDGKVVCLVLMDLSKAFDCIPHKLLISKFKAYGLSFSACDLLISYFKDRKQRVKLGNAKSEWQNVRKGTAQGSLFGPFSYNVFTNDMLHILDDSVEIYNYADDNTLLSAGYNYKHVKEHILSNVNRVISWFENNSMKVNPDKFQCIVFGKVSDPGTFSINGNAIMPEQTVKLLGLHIDRKLDFKYHISQICQKAGRQVQVLCRLSRTLDDSNKLLLYNSFIECYFNYCSIVWHSCSIKDTMKLEKIQQKALRFITLDFSNSYPDLLNKCDKSPLYVIRLRKIVELIYRINNGMSPSYLGNIIKHREVTKEFRSNNRIAIPKFRTVKYGKKSICYLASMLWNSLDNNSRLADNLNSFKIQVRMWNGPTCKCGFCIKCKILHE